MLECLNLGYYIGEKYLFKNISFTLMPGAFLVVEGPNGSGKTTLLRMIAGLISGEGNILVDKTPLEDLKKPWVNYIGHNLALKAELDVKENLEFWAKIYSSPELIKASIHYFNLYDYLDMKIYELSAGQKRRVALAKLLACNADIWVLDEIDQNLDTENLALLHNVIQIKANQGGIIIFSTHNPEKIKKKHSINLLDYAICR